MRPSKVRAQKNGLMRRRRGQQRRGSINEGELGHIANRQVSGTTPLYRLLSCGTGDVFHTRDYDESRYAQWYHGYTDQGVTGYPHA